MNGNAETTIVALEREFKTCAAKLSAHNSTTILALEREVQVLDQEINELRAENKRLREALGMIEKECRETGPHDTDGWVETVDKVAAFARDALKAHGPKGEAK